MDRDIYLNTREKLLDGQVDEDGLRLYYEYWTTFRKENYQDIDFNKFCDTFPTYIQQGLNFNSSLGRIFSHFDALHSVQTVIDKQGRELAIR